MKTRTKFFFLQALLLGCLWPAATQAQTLDLTTGGEHSLRNGESQESAQQLALIAARRRVLRMATVRLKETAEVKAIPFKANQIEAFLPTLVTVEDITAPTTNPVMNKTFRTANVRVRINIAETTRLMNLIRKDPNAAERLVEMWSQNEELYPRLESIGQAPNQPAQQEPLTLQHNVTRLVSLVYASLAKTEESPASRRVPSRKGRQRAMQMANAAILLGPNSPETHLAMGDVLMDMDETPAAESEYRQALALGAKSASAHIKLADALRAGGKGPEAVAELNEALKIDPKSPTAHTDMGYLLGTQQKNAEAIAEYREALRFDPDFIEAHNYLAIAFARQGQFPDAVAQFREIVRADPDSVLGYYNMGIALADMDQDAESAEAMRQAVRINPNHFNARYDLGELFRLEGKLDEAVKQFREYLRLAPDTAQNQRNIRRAKDFVQTNGNP